jgi:hypothetical protein
MDTGCKESADNLESQWALMVDNVFFLTKCSQLEIHINEVFA